MKQNADTKKCPGKCCPGSAKGEYNEPTIVQKTSRTDASKAHEILWTAIMNSRQDIKGTC